MAAKATYFGYINNKFDELNITKNPYSTLQHHKILYFSLAYSLSHFNKDCFENVVFEAWKNGPVEREARNKIVHMFNGSVENYFATAGDKTFDSLSKEEIFSINKSIELFGSISPVVLSQLTHVDIFLNSGNTPWRDANCEGEHCTKEITRDSIAKFYNEEWFDSFSRQYDEIMNILKG